MTRADHRTEASLLEDYLSGDVDRIRQAIWATLDSRDPKVLDPLVAAVPRIRKAVEEVQLGGAINSYANSFQHALTKLDNYRHGKCWCANYPGLSIYRPRKEQGAGHIRIVSTSPPAIAMTYVVECGVCGTVFDVEEGCGHAPWWAWRPRSGNADKGRRRKRGTRG